MIPKCPHCDDEYYIYITGRAGGAVQQYFDLSGKMDGVDTDKMIFKYSHTIRCAGCGKIRRDLILDGDTVKPIRATLG